MIGHNAFGHPVFATTRPPVGELLYKLKNRGDAAAMAEIVDAAAAFLKGWGVGLDAMVPVPPSNTSRKHQPVIAVANALSDVFGIPVCEGCVMKVKRTGQLQDVFDFAKRTEILTGAFTVDAATTKGKRLLLLDDLYRSGRTVSTIAQLLLTAYLTSHQRFPLRYFFPGRRQRAPRAANARSKVTRVPSAV